MTTRDRDGLLRDEAARRRIRTELTQTLFVEAGAGSGKTSELVARICALVESGVPMRTIAAITFTEKAAAELRDRVRVGLEGAAAAARKAGDPAIRDRCRAALDDLDGAAVGTLHSFAARILAEHPVQAGVPPLLTTLDEVGQQVAFERRWTEIRGRLVTDPGIASTLRSLLDQGTTLEQVRSVLAALEASWDLAEERLADGVAGDEPTAEPAVAGPLDAVPDLSRFLRLAAAATALASRCRSTDDLLLKRVRQIADIAEDLPAADPAEVIGLLCEIPNHGRTGTRRNWDDVEAARAAVGEVAAEAGRLIAAAQDAQLRRLVHWLAGQVLVAAGERQASGRLEFHDLLVLARRVLRDPVHGPSVRAALRRRYSHLLLDEFQDTDPIQVELAVRIAAGATPGSGAAAWRDVPVPGGSLFVVGDPKQSIYRFRRADIAAYLRTRDHLGGVVELTTNFRSTKPLLTWVNAVFGQLITPAVDAQPDYVALDPDPARPAWSSDDSTLGPVVTVLGARPHPDGTKAGPLRAAEAADVAAVVVQMLTEGWQRDVKDPGPDGDPRWQRRALQPSDICLLVPARTSLETLEAALDAAGVPYRTEVSSLVYASREIRELLTAVRALDDRSDELALVATLRSALFGCGDDDLLRWRAAGGRWNYGLAAPDGVGAGDPVHDALQWLHDLARRLPALAPSEVLAEIVTGRRVLEVALDSDAASQRPRHREIWRRVRFVIDQARAWSQAEHGSLREYLAWADRQAADDARVEEEVLPETDADSVRIMTIHAAKGLQFPVVVLSGMTSTPGGAIGPRLLWQGPRGWELRLRKGLQTVGFDQADAVERDLERLERLRLLYVACTRAESHLVVSLHREAAKTADSAAPWAHLLAPVVLSPAVTDRQTLFAAPEQQPVLDAGRPPGAPPAPTYADWSGWQRGAIASGSLRAAVSATDAAASGAVSLPSVVVEGLQKQPRDLELPPWAKGRYGTAVGRAVHAALQSLDLGAPRDVAAVCESFALAEAVPEHAEVVEALVRSGLASSVVQRAAVRRHWKETYVGTVIDGTLIEGYVDLLYEEDDGTLVVVDYKTDAELGRESRRAYATQVAIYARAVEDASGRTVSRRLLVNCRPGAATEIPV